MGIQSHFNNFHTKIKLGRQDSTYKSARDRDDKITKAIRESFKQENYPVVSDFIQGSLATSTAIVPISGDYDVDRALVIADDNAPDNPIDPKINAFEVLENRGFKNAKIKKPCVTADYSSENVHIDFPVYKIRGDQHYLAVGKRNSDEANRSWAAADPRGLIDWINDASNHGHSSDKKQDQYKRLVQYFKRWRDHQFSEAVATKIFSIGLTVMAKECFTPSFDDEGFRQDLESLRKTAEHMLNAGYFSVFDTGKFMVCVSLPVQPWRDIFTGSSVDTGTQFRNKLANLRDKLIEAEAIDDVRKQCQILNKLFGDDFEVPDPPVKSESTAKAVYPTAGAVGTSQGA